MTDDIHVSVVVSGAAHDWIIRGYPVNRGPMIAAHTTSRAVAALCLGAKFLNSAVTIERDESGDIVKAEVL